MQVQPPDVGSRRNRHVYGHVYSSDHCALLEGIYISLLSHYR
jgi:hypothetical protein